MQWLSVPGYSLWLPRIMIAGVIMVLNTYLFLWIINSILLNVFSLARLEETARAASLYRAVQTYVGGTGGNKERDRSVGEEEFNS